MQNKISSSRKKPNVLKAKTCQFPFYFENKQNKENKKFWNVLATTHSFNEGTLTISGDGEMTDFGSQNSTSWGINATSIIKIIIEKPITSVGSHSFDGYYTNIESVEIANTVEKIKEWAFCNCVSLRSLILPKSLTLIDYAAFYQCMSLASLILPNSLTKIGDFAIGECNALALLILPNNLSIISVYCFAHCHGLTSLIIPVGVTSLKANAFNDCIHLKSINISHTVKSIENNVFQDCFELACVYYDGTTDPESSFSDVFGNTDVFLNTNVEKVRVSTNYPNGSTFCGKPTEIGVSCVIIKMRSKTFSPTIKSKLSSSLRINFYIVIRMMIKCHWELFLFQ